MQTTTASDLSTSPSILDLAESFDLDLRSRNRTEKTRRTYREAIDQFAAFLDRTGMPTAVAAITREHVQSFIVDLSDRGMSPATCRNRFASLKALFNWATDEGEIVRSPMEKMSPPSLPEKAVPILDDDAVERLLKTCGTDFAGRRDRAIITTFLSSGLRLAELTNLTEDDLRLRDGVIHVRSGKGGKERFAYLNPNAVRDLDRYLRARRGRNESALWVGKRGAMTTSGVAQMLRKRGARAGIVGLHPHRLRHTWAHRSKLAGMSDDALVRLAGWSDRSMLLRYGASASQDRALEEARRIDG
jgi:site-specific recombinase XerD